MTELDEKKKSNRGFGGMSEEKRKRIAAMGGKAVPASKRAFAVNSQLARSAGRKGGKAAHADKAN